MSGPLEIVGDDHGLVCTDGVCEVPPIDADSGETDRAESGPNISAR
ncbi:MULTISPECIES: hypothetical protein [unclassified Rhodococcus (in: high G+C Gram-positive bacteria)]|nr:MULTISPECIES: hypothetical protein [unclassified Rhodococcus (in: high G+C Gram-positive bacteria)]